jgi:hypothetical protein
MDAVNAISCAIILHIKLPKHACFGAAFGKCEVLLVLLYFNTLSHGTNTGGEGFHCSLPHKSADSGGLSRRTFNFEGSSGTYGE